MNRTITEVRGKRIQYGGDMAHRNCSLSLFSENETDMTRAQCHLQLVFAG